MTAIETYLAFLAALVTWSELERWRKRREDRRAEEEAEAHCKRWNEAHPEKQGAERRGDVQ